MICKQARVAAVGLTTLLALVGCGSDDNESPSLDGGTQTLDAATPSPTGQLDASAPSTGPAIYAYGLEIPDPDGNRLFYTAITNSPSLGSIKKESLRMFAPYSGFQVVDGFLFVGDGAGPFVTKFRITDQLGYEEVAKINFSQFPLSNEEALNFYYANFKSGSTVYHHYGEDKSFRIVWDPAAAKIVTSKTDTKLPAPTATTALNATGNRTGIKWFKGPVMQAFNQKILATEGQGPESYIAVYDEVTHDEKSVVTISNCPGLEQATMDEDGNVYFGTTFGIAIDALYKKGPAPCVVRMKADGTLDPTFEQTDLTKYTGGHYAVNFRYLRDGKATALVLHEERTNLKFEGAPDYALADKFFEDRSLWDFTMIDLKAGTSKVVTGFKPGTQLRLHHRIIRLEGRDLLVHANDDGTTTTYELHTDGTATFDAEVIGEVWSADRVR